jgi:sugar/nucleoside kinase (ribokinase family)
MIACVTFGVIVDDLVTWRGEVHMGVLGGGGVQSAWGMTAALGDGAQVGLVSGIGVDLEASALLPLNQANIDLHGLRPLTTPTPRAWQLIEADGSRTQVWRTPTHTLGAALARRWDVLPPSYQQAHSFHWGIHPEQPDLALAQQLVQLGKTVSLEAFRAPAQPLTDAALTTLMRACTIFSATMSEASAMIGSDDPTTIRDRFRAAGCHILALRRGAHGSQVWDFIRGEQVAIPAYPTVVTDTTGAGNAWCGALLARLGDGLQAAVCHAATAASYMIEQVGIPPGLPTQAEYAARYEALWRERSLSKC